MVDFSCSTRLCLSEIQSCRTPLRGEIFYTTSERKGMRR